MWSQILSIKLIIAIFIAVNYRQAKLEYRPSLHLGQLTFSLKRRESEPSQVVVLCCLALFIVSQLFNHVHVHYM